MRVEKSDVPHGVQRKHHRISRCEMYIVPSEELLSAIKRRSNICALKYFIHPLEFISQTNSITEDVVSYALTFFIPYRNGFPLGWTHSARRLLARSSPHQTPPFFVVFFVYLAIIARDK